jgi:hypothetical protein
LKRVISHRLNRNYLFFLALSLTVVLPSTIPVLSPNLIWADTQPSFLYPIQDDAFHYYSRIKAILSGNFMINNPYFYGTSPGWGYTFIGEYWVAFLSVITGSIKFGYFLQVIFFTSLIFYTMEQVLKLFIKRSLFWTFVFVNTSFLLFPIWYLRPVAPSTAIILFLIVLMSSMKLLHNSERIFYWYLNTFCIILLWFTQPVVAIIATVSWGYTVFIILKFFKIRHFKKIGLLLVSLVFLPIFWYLTVNYPYHSLKQETATRTGLIDSRMPGGLKELIISFIVILLFLALSWKLKIKDVRFIHLSLFLSFANLGGNHQILSGKHAFNSAYSRPIIYLICILLAIIILGNLIRNFQISKTMISMIAITILISSFLHTYSEISDLQNNKPDSLIIDISYLSGLNDLNRLKSENVIAAPVSISSLLPFYTNSKSLYAKEGSILYPVSDNEVLERALLNRFILNELNLSKEDVEWMFDGYFNNIRMRYYWDRNNQQDLIQFRINYLYQKAMFIKKEISSNPGHFLQKYSVSGVIYFSGQEINNRDSCKSLTKGDIYSFCEFRV